MFVLLKKLFILQPLGAWLKFIKIV